MSVKLETPEVLSECVVDSWEELEHESMREGHRETLERCIAVAIRADRQAVLDQTAKLALTVYPCSCDAAYKDREMTAPDCFRCNALEDAAEAIRAFANELAAEEGK